MENNRLFIKIKEKNSLNEQLLSKISNYVENNTDSIVYVITAPLIKKYSYSYEPNALVILSPKEKIVFVNLGTNNDLFDDYVDEFIEDIGSLSDSFEYKTKIGRPRNWRNDITTTINLEDIESINSLFESNTLPKDKQRIGELIITLLIGSINDIQKIGVDEPVTPLERVRRNILLFDADQTRFIYKEYEPKMISVQGLSGTGKTELLLHKLKEIYVADENSKIFFTCHNIALANSLRNRIPKFFNFMQVKKQIEWDKCLWVDRAWGTRNNYNSGLYTYLCHFYEAQFYPYSRVITYDFIFKKLLQFIESIPEKDFLPAFDYIIIDERQDFPDSFFDLCKKVTKYKVYAAGDIFQDIFETSKESKIPVDISLNRCYRTDPRTLMFAHAVGMGLFEKKKLNWLNDSQWEEMGYSVERIKDQDRTIMRLKREPIRRFGDTKLSNASSLQIEHTTYYKDIISILRKLRQENHDIRAHEVAIIVLDDSKNMYDYIDGLCPKIIKEMGWDVVRGYERKEVIEDKLYITNPNNVKGLEFPFVLCVSGMIKDTYKYRNILYTMVTRSFLKTFILLTDISNIKPQQDGLDIINKYGYIQTSEPTSEEIGEIQRTLIQFHTEHSIPFDKYLISVFQELDIYDLDRRKRFEEALANVSFDKFDRELTIDFIKSNMKFI